MKKCDCHHSKTYISVDDLKGSIKHECWGTRERDICSCGGDRTKCDFYPEVREKALSEIEPEFGEWISVEYNKPKNNGYYLCWYMKSKCGNKEEWQIDKFYWEDNLWLFHHNRFNVADNVTHWMYLPEPPKGE